MCDGEHPVYRCEEFKKLSPTERIKKVNEKHLCYNCLKFGRHSAKDCRSERVCNFHGCQGKHSYLLHDALTKGVDGHQENEPVTNNTQEQNKSADSYAIGPANKEAKFQKIALPIVPVFVRGSGEKVVETFALLDTGSNMTFCSRALIDQLDIKGKAQSLSLSTLNHKDKVQAIAVDLEVQGTFDDCHQHNPIPLPHVLAIKEFPSLVSSVANKEELKTYEHLRDLPMPDTTQKKVKLLIGQDNAHVLTPLEIRRGASNEPYAVKTKLGWTINGPLQSRQEASDNKISGGDAKNMLMTGVCNFVSKENDTLLDAVENFWKVDSYGTNNKEP